MKKGLLLFLREQMPLLFIYVLQLALISFVYWLGGMRDSSLTLYTILLSGILFVAYSLYRYYTHRHFYERLARPKAANDELTYRTEHAPLAESLHELLLQLDRNYKTRLLSVNEQLDQHIHFINQWVHQMKTPLSVMHLINQERDDESSLGMGDELDRMRKGLDMVLYTARLDSFEHDLHIETLSLFSTVRAITSDQKRLFIRNHVFPVIQIHQDIKVVSDEKWLKFMITQLLTNSVKYSHRTNAKIYFESYTRDNRTVLEVKDEGIGIPKQDLGRVFNPFFTGENGRTVQESTGMGLYLVKEVCEKLGHQIEIDSVQGKGTSVRLIF
ncbi:HAMP domain-containing histidine kinase [Paenibacillus sp. Marseille-Q4541]|uniref:HAMP domain-containing histidine kinase n=1 Tax=Paenibacillus sp. Marseille-Q4541 TaxID=2831522 RepID=UPI001BA8D29F|nr:HAMP domain-containing histidine kinase [Paenibacillus sp. Marseille-Q4541]